MDALLAPRPHCPNHECEFDTLKYSCILEFVNIFRACHGGSEIQASTVVLKD